MYLVRVCSVWAAHAAGTIRLQEILSSIGLAAGCCATLSGACAGLDIGITSLDNLGCGQVQE